MNQEYVFKNPVTAIEGLRNYLKSKDDDQTLNFEHLLNSFRPLDMCDEEFLIMKISYAMGQGYKRKFVTEELIRLIKEKL